MVGDVGEDEGHSEFERGLENADVGVRVHPFVGDDEGVERHRHQLDYHHADRALIDPQRGNFALRRYVHVGFKEPQSEGLAQEQQECAEDDLQKQGSGEDALGVFTTTDFESEEAADGGGDAGSDHRKECDDAADRVIHAEIPYTQCLEHNSRREQSDAEQHQHPHVKKCRVACDPPAVLRYFRLLGHNLTKLMIFCEFHALITFYIHSICA